MDLTQEYFDIALKGLYDHFDGRFNDVESRLEKVEATLEVHTRALDKLLKDLDNRETEKLVFVYRMERMEKAVKEVADKVGVKIDF